VTQEGVYLGGAITPGLRTFIDSLTHKAPRLPEISLVDKTPETLHIGANTIDCMEAGLGLGYRGLMKELLAASATALLPDETLLTIATGGLAESVIRICGLQDEFQVVDPVLTLKGLQLIYSYNRSHEAIGHPS
jgi:type III pantothenate kinase